jgi:NADH:ubiquinone oxidoreductase subunit 3 (subunit A)
MSFEDEYVGRSRKKSGIAPWLPALGLILVVALAGVSFVLSEPVHEAVYEAFFRDEEIASGTFGTEDSFDQENMQYVVGGIMFLVLLMTVGFLYAVFSPKGPKKITEADMRKERKQKQAEILAAKKHKQAMNKQYAKEREAKMKAEEEASRKARRRQ